MICFSFLFLIIMVIFAPIILLKNNDHYLLQQIYVEDLVNETKELERSQLSTQEKIDLLSKYPYEHQIILSTHEEIINEEDKEKINDIIVNELKTLKTLHIIPEFDIQENYDIYDVSTYTYSDTSQLNHHVSLWYVYLNSSQHSIHLEIDIENHHIYQLVIKGQMDKVDTKKALNSFNLQYLNLKENNANISINQKKYGYELVIGREVNESSTSK